MACAIFLGAAGCHSADATDPNDAFVAGLVTPGVTTSLTLDLVQGRREYLLHDSQGASEIKVALPLVVLLHGSGLTAADMRASSAMDSIADIRHFLVAYPQGVGSPSDWNAGDCCGDSFANKTDDIAFIKAVIADVSKRLLVDPRRVYVGGFSDGARMAYRVACEMSTQIAAVAAVSGSLVTERCAPTRLIPIIAFHGNNDQSVLYAEPAATPLPRAAPASASAFPPSIKFWLATASCKGTQSLLVAATTVRYTGSGCGADVAFYATFGGIHAWPVHGPDYSIDASPLIVDFFQAHKLP